ncbi:hypothetical protein HYE68_002590 [Fusarium pseudograminearum]|nr:hypothetical protein HYE68_002590 [Fusarium pseudograminearum]
MASGSAFVKQPDIDYEAVDEALDESPLELSVSGEEPPVHSNELKKKQTDKGKGKEIAENDTLPMVHEPLTEEAEAEEDWNDQSGFSEPWRQLHPGDVALDMNLPGGEMNEEALAEFFYIFDCVRKDVAHLGRPKQIRPME